MTKKSKGIIAIGILLFLLAAMFLFSSQNSVNTTSLSMKVTRIITKLTFFNYDEMTSSQQIFIVKELNYFIRKVAHFLIYMLIGMCSYYLMLLLDKKVKRKVLIATAMCFIYAVSDEIHQHFVPGRDCKVTDVILDLVGAFFGMLILRIIFILIEYIKNIAKEQKVLKGR